MPDYKSCMAQKMGNGSLKGLDKDTRRITFCALAKECSKGIPHEEAMKICRSLPPKEPKEKKARKKAEAAECPVFDTTTLIPHCEAQLGKMVKSGELQEGTDITGICQLILA